MAPQVGGSRMAGHTNDGHRGETASGRELRSSPPIARRETPMHIIPIVLAALTVLLCVVAATDLPGSDEHIFRYVGFAWFRTDDLPYRDAFENKPPGIFLFWGLVWLCADGAPIVGRLLGLGANCVSAVLIGALAGQLWSRHVERLTTALLIATVCLWDFDLPFADTETFGTAFSLAALYLVWPRDGRALSAVRTAVAGLFLGVAVLFKPVFVIEAIIAVALIVLSPGRLPRRLGLGAVVPAAALLPVLACLAYFRAHDALGDFFDVVVGSLSAPGTIPRGTLWERTGVASFKILQYLMLPLVVALVAFAASSTRGLRQGHQKLTVALCFVWIGVVFLTICIQGRAFGHQFRQAVPPLCILAAGGLSGVWLTNDKAGTAGWTCRHLAACVVVVAMALSLLHTAKHVTEAAASTHSPSNGPAPGGLPEMYLSSPEVVRALTKPTDRIWCYPRRDLYAKARRLSASRYFSEVFLSRPEAQADVLQRLGSGAARLVLIDWANVQHGWMSACFETADRPAFDAKLSVVLREHFVHRGRAGDWDVYEYNPERARGE
jgi:hypothetical protein